MPKRSMLVLGFLLLMRLSLIAADLDSISAPAAYVPIREIPIDTGTANSNPSYFQATVAPLVTQRGAVASGTLADSANEYVDFGWHIPILSMFSVGYDTGVNAFRQDQTIWDDEQATSQVSTAFINKASITVQSGTNVHWTNYVQGQRSFTDGIPGYSDATKYGTQATWSPNKGATAIGIQASTQQTYNFNHGILDENLYTTTLDQKLPWMPLTLHTGGSVTDDTAPLLPASDKDNTVIDASLLWKVVPSASCSAGVQRQDTTIPASVQLANTNVYFTQVSLQPAQAWTLTMRAAHEQTAATQAGQFLSNTSDVLLSFGLTWALGDRFNAGAGLNYRFLQSATPTPTVTTPPATLSISAGGNF